MTRWALLAGAMILLLVLSARLPVPRPLPVPAPVPPPRSRSTPPRTDPPPPPETTTSPGTRTAPVAPPPVREPEWQELFARLEALRADDYPGAAAVIKDVAAWLDLHRASLDGAFADLLLFDSNGKGFAASALATALGRIPDEATALRLADCIQAVSSLKLAVDIVYALGQDRYRVGRASGKWGLNTGLVECGTTVEPAVAAKLIPLAGGTTVLPSAVMTVLGFSQSQEPVRKLFADLAAQVEDGSRPDLANSVAQAFSLADDEESLAVVNRLAESKDKEVREAFVGAALRRGSPSIADAMIRRIVDDGTSLEEKQGIANRMIGLRTKDPGALARIEAIVHDLLARDDRPGDQGIAITLAGVLGRQAKDFDGIMGAILRIALREEAPEEVRAEAVSALWGDHAQRERLKKILDPLVFDEKAPVSVRAAAVERIWQWTPEPDRPALVEDYRKRLPAEVIRRSHYLR